MSHEAHIFISYAREDSEFALRLARDLRSEGVEIWLDQLDIPPGVRWDRAIEQALRTCDRLLVILSPASVASESVLDEVAFAFEQKKRIVPVLYRPCEIPLRLLRLQYVDFTGDYNRGLTVLLAELQKAVAPPPVKPMAPPAKPFPRPAAAIWGTALLVVLVGIVLVAKPWHWLSTSAPTTVAKATATLPVSTAALEWSAAWPPTTVEKATATLSVGTASPRPTATLLPPTPTSTLLKHIEIDISEQKLTAWDGKKLVYSFVCSTGKPETPTQFGRFSVISKLPEAYSSTWNIWMPYWLGVYWADGTENGIHGLPTLSSGQTLWAGYLGQPISYGSIVLDTWAAKQLYEWAEIGTEVIIQE